MDNNQKKLIIISFIIMRNLINEILLRPQHYVKEDIGKNGKDNLKYLGSVLYHIATDLLNEIFNDQSKRGGKIVNLYAKSDLYLVLTKIWTEQMKGLLKDWLNACLKFIIELKF